MKKKLFIIPVTLLLLLLFAYCGTTYAWQYELTSANVSSIATHFHNNQTFVNRCVNAYNTLKTHNCDSWFICYDYRNGNGTLLLYTINKSQITAVGNVNNVNYMNITFTGDLYHAYIGWNASPQYATYSDRNVTFGSGSQRQTQYLFYSNDILNRVTGPYESTQVIGPFVEPAYYLFNQTPSNTNVNVDIFEDIPAYNRSATEDLYLGYLMKPKEKTITNFSMLRAYYTGEYWKYIEVTTDKQNNYIYYDKYYEDEVSEMYDVYFRRQNIQDNNIYIITWSDQTEEPYENLTATFYIMNNQTIIINGEVIPPSGDNIQGTIGELQEDINENNNFWKNTYNRLMQPSGEVIQKEFENLIKEVEWTSGDVSGELAEALAGLEIINNNPGDFIIAWNPTQSKLSIGGQQLQNQLEIGAGQINFSQMERDSEELQDVMFYARAILSFAIFVMFGRNLWRTLLRTFGVDTSIYDTTTEEQKVAKKNEENWKNQLEKQKYNEWLKSHRK